MNNPTPNQMTQMIEAIFARCDQLLTHHDLPKPGDSTGFAELLRLAFDDDAAGRQIFDSFDDMLLEELWQMYQKRFLTEE